MLVGYGEYALARLVNLPQQFREFPQRLRAKNKIHMTVGLLDSPGYPFLLSHTAAENDHLFRVLLFRVGEDPQVPEYPLFGVFPNRAGVQQNQVRLAGILRKGKPHRLQHPHEALSVRHVLLTAERFDTGRGMGLTFREHSADFILKIPLTGDIRLGD